MEFRNKFHAFRIVSYQLNYVSKDHPTQTEVYSDHLEQYGIIFKTLEMIPRNAPCCPVILMGICPLR